jgi:hypothetical protein
MNAVWATNAPMAATSDNQFVPAFGFGSAFRWLTPGR